MNKYINADDYLKAKGTDLRIELQDNDNKSHKVDRFIKDITDWCCDYLRIHYCSNELNDFDNLKPFRQEYFRKGVMDQIEYLLSNGNIALNSGIDATTGAITDYDTVVMGKAARQDFFLGAFMNINRE